MQNTGGRTGTKRRVSTCMPCYARKQKCDRRYPCQHCTRRRRPEECVYNYPTPPAGSAVRAGRERGDAAPSSRYKGDHTNSAQLLRHESPLQANALGVFGWAEDSSSNTIAILKSLDPSLVDNGISRSPDSLPYIMDSARWDLGRMPDRQTLDVLIQYYVSELNWMKQLIHPPSFLTRYQQWWSKDRPLWPADIEFAVLILRICLYTAQFLPSPSHLSDRVNTATLPDIRTRCSEVADRLAKICVILDWKGSLTRVQHVLFAAIKSCCEGRTDQFWEGIAEASQAAQKAGLHKDVLENEAYETEIDKEMRRRVYCTVYHLDSHLSRQLDRIPFLPKELPQHSIPRMHFDAENAHIDRDAQAPDLYTERLLQVQLAQFWRNHSHVRHSEYDGTQAEQRHEQFLTEFLQTVHPAFALKPNTKWDAQCHRLPMQRQLLYIAMFDYICWNFRPLLLLKPMHVARMPRYKQVLLQSHKRVLATAALKQLEATASLHSLLDGGFPRFGAIVFSSFEAAVILLALYSQLDFPGPDDDTSHSSGFVSVRLTRRSMMLAVEKALDRLQKLADINNMASAAVKSLNQIISNLSSLESRSSSISTSTSSTWNFPLPMELLGCEFNEASSAPSTACFTSDSTDPLSMLPLDDSYLNMQINSAAEFLPNLDFLT